MFIYIRKQNLFGAKTALTVWEPGEKFSRSMKWALDWPKSRWNQFPPRDTENVNYWVLMTSADPPSYIYSKTRLRSRWRQQGRSCYTSQPFSSRRKLQRRKVWIRQQPTVNLNSTEAVEFPKYLRWADKRIVLLKKWILKRSRASIELLIARTPTMLPCCVAATRYLEKSAREASHKSISLCTQILRLESSRNSLARPLTRTKQIRSTWTNFCRGRSRYWQRFHIATSSTCTAFCSATTRSSFSRGKQSHA